MDLDPIKNFRQTEMDVPVPGGSGADFTAVCSSVDNKGSTSSSSLDMDISDKLYNLKVSLFAH